MDDLRQMLELVKDPNPQIRKYALSQVEELADGVDDEDVLEALRHAARDAVPLVSHQAIRSLARLLGRAFMAGRRRAAGPGGEDGSFEGVPLYDLRSAGLEVLGGAIDRLEALVRSDDKRAARRSLIALGKVAAPGSVRVIAECLNDPELAGAAAIALPGIGGEEALKPLVAAAKDLSSPARIHAALELGRFREDASLDALLELAGDENAAIRANVAMALGEQVPGPRTREALAKLLNDAEVWVTVYGVRSLARDLSAETAQLVATCYHKVEDSHVRASCVAVLGNLGDVAKKAAEAVLADAIRHPDDRVRANAVEAVGSLVSDPQRAVAMVAPLSTDPNNRVMANVAVTLALHDVPAALEVLGRMAALEDKWFRTSAAWAAGCMGRPEAFPVLTQLATNTEPNILLMVVRSLEAVPAAEAAPLLTRLATHADPLVRARAYETLGKVGADSVCQFLAARLAQEPDAQTRAALVNAIAATRAPAAVGALSRALSDNFARVQANAVEQLGRLGSLEVLSLVRPLASGENNRLRANAWIALWRLGEVEMADHVAQALARPDDNGLFSAVFAVGEMGRELRQLGQQSSNLLLLSALKEKSKAGLGVSQATLSVIPGVTEGKDDAEVKIEEALTHLLVGAAPELEAAVAALPPATPPGVGAYLLSRSRLARQDQAGGLQLLEEACAAGIACVSPYLELANYYLRNRRDRDAADHFLRAYGMRREALGGLAEASRKAMEAGNLSVVSRVLKFLFGQQPMSADTHARVGHEYLALAELEDAFRHLALARVEFPRDAHVALDYALAALRTGRHGLAGRVLEAGKRLAGADARLQQRVAALSQVVQKGGPA